MQEAATKNENTFEQLLEATKYCSLGQLTDAMFGVGGAVSEQYGKHGSHEKTNARDLRSHGAVPVAFLMRLE